ncbi:amino acid ABC transporter permease [Aestuariispira insulae]|uniref:General L-amino acid transport system permease protein n=1 Tax=Aestuariispira insulae TaxID=1461337 RepID=A0A3D9HWS4_9PROT|nr:general L-amino acid transport system permease protein [Aestuariispira insulae]
MSKAYVNDERHPDLPPPASTVGAVGWMREHLFSSPANILMTVVSIGLLAYVVPPMVSWLFTSAVWSGGADACRANPDAACWTFVGARFDQFVYGFYEKTERWRVDIMLILLFAGIAALVYEKTPGRKWIGMFMLIGYPILSWIMLLGGDWGTPNISLYNVIVVLLPIVGIALLSYDRLPSARTIGIVLTAFYLLAIALLLGLTAAGKTELWIGSTVIYSLVRLDTIIITLIPFLGLFALTKSGEMERRGTIGIAMLVVFAILVLGFFFDLPAPSSLDMTLVDRVVVVSMVEVPTKQWGGFMLTLVIALTGIVASLPLGVLLALGRRSNMPAIRVLCVVFIEFWRGVPLITVLFMASVMLPLFLPPGVSFDQLLRALIGVALFSAAYMAEVVRGGLQAIPKGQYEGADSLGLTYWQKMRLIILPQALKIVIPGIVNTFIGLFKDTTLVLIIGLFDLLGAVQASIADPNWNAKSVAYTGYVFTAFVFWVCCYGMSQYSRYLERKLHTGHKR